MDRSPPLITPVRAVIFLGGLAAVVALVILATSSEPPRAPTVDGGVASPTEPSSERHRPVQPRSLARRSDRPPNAKRMETPPPPEEDIWAMVPDEQHLRELQEREFELAGGIDSPGSEAGGPLREVDEPEWAEQTEVALRRSFMERVMAEGTTIQRLDCERGRCLLELTFDGMVNALDRVEPLRSWAAEDVPCRVFSDGPTEPESPNLPDVQQVWILCGNPSDEP